jgi:hypothetical protein
MFRTFREKLVLVMIVLLAASGLFTVSAIYSHNQVLADVVAVSPSASPSPSPSGDASQTPTPTPSTTTSPAPTPTPTPTIDPAALQDLRYRNAALINERNAKKAHAKLAKLRKAFSLRMTSGFKLQPRSNFDTWKQRWYYFKYQAKRYRGWNAYYWRKMVILPRKSSNAATWWPLARYVGWPAHERSNWIFCVTAESNDEYWAMNPSGAAGLMQIDPACRGWKTPIINIKAGLAKYLANRRQGHSGWGPWTTMKYRIGW